MSAVLPCVDRLDLRRLEPPEPLALVLDALGMEFGARGADTVSGRGAGRARPIQEKIVP